MYNFNDKNKSYGYEGGIDELTAERAVRNAKTGVKSEPEIEEKEMLTDEEIAEEVTE